MRRAYAMIARRPSLAIVGAALAVFGLTRALHPVQGLGNPDIAGILYSADALNAGLLPYRDTIDVKQPASFFLIAAVFRVSRSIRAVHAAYAIWLLLGAPAIWIAARALYRDGRDEADNRDARAGDPRALAPAIATSLYLFTAGLFDFNYAAWLMPPYAWSFALLCLGLHDRRTRGVRWHLLAGLFASLAYLFKAQAVVLALLFPAMFLWARRRGEPGASWRAWPAWIAGAALGVLPLAAFYASRRALPDLARGLFPLGDAAAYSAGSTALKTYLGALWYVPSQHLRVFPLAITLGVAALVGVRRAAAGPAQIANHPSLVPALLFYGASVLGCSIGTRFFIHYLPQCLPAAALLGAHPAARDWLLAPRAALASRAAYVASRAHAALATGLLLFLLGSIPFLDEILPDNRGSPDVEAAGKYVRARTTPGEHLFVWGWPGWGVYYFSERRSPSAIFKVLGQVTTYNDNTGFSSSHAIRFKPGPLADRLLADLRARPPSFIVRAVPFFPHTARDPLDEWPELKTMLDDEYQMLKRYPRLAVYERKGRPRGYLK